MGDVAKGGAPAPSTTGSKDSVAFKQPTNPLNTVKSEAEKRQLPMNPQAIERAAAKGNEKINTTGPMPTTGGINIAATPTNVVKTTNNTNTNTTAANALDNYFANNNKQAEKQTTSLEVQNAELKKQTLILAEIAATLSSKGKAPDQPANTRDRTFSNGAPNSNLQPPLVPVNRSY